MEFTPLPPLPPNVRLSPLTDWRHRPTPGEIRAERDNIGGPVVWVSDDHQLAGIIAPDQEVAWDLGAGSRTETAGSLGSVELEFGRPGKGAGYFVLVFVRPGEPRPILVAKAEPFDDEHLVWFSPWRRHSRNVSACPRGSWTLARTLDGGRLDGLFAARANS